MQVHISSVSVLKGLHNLRLERWVGQKIVGTPHGGGFFANQIIPLPVHADVHSHIIGALVNTADRIFSASQRPRHSNGISNRNA